MAQVIKSRMLSRGTADAVADIELINRYSKTQLAPDEVYAYSMVLCDTEVDRDTERFTVASLEKLAGLFLGKPGIRDHRRTSEGQHSRIYRTQVEMTEKKNALGDPLVLLRADAYMLKTEVMQPMIDAIEGGILKEVSVGCHCAECNCSICGKPIRIDWKTWTEQCETGHIKGQKYDGQLCVGLLEKPVDAVEFSFVPVPSQRAAGVIKSAEDVSHAIELLKAADLTQFAPELKELMPVFQTAFVSADERAKRAQIAAEARAQLKPKS